ncbi:MAG: RNA-directed DNA polymerase [Promethearchaeota archaeon]|nr:MAG: RNA-directed DNA polymerase [Candidatus Lokiarchaeota archaeon]
MEDYWYIVIGMVALLVIFCLCIGFSGGKWNYAAYIKEKNERVQRKRWNKYVKFLDPVKETELLNIIKLSSDADFEAFLKEIQPLLTKKYNPYNLNEQTLLKRTIYNVINRYTTQFKYDRVKKIEAILPMLKRVFLGPRLTNQVYSKKTLKRRFKFPLKSGVEIPKLDTIIDVAFFFNISVNKILGLCYMQEKNPGAYYVKREIIYDQMGEKGIILHQKDPAMVQLDSSYAIAEPNILKKKKSNQNEGKNSEDIQEKLEEIKPSFKEYSSPFYKRKMLTKPDGRKRLIACPVSYLKKYQRKILGDILEKVALPTNCTGFVKNRSIISNAANHVGSQTLVKIDLKNFFNSMKFYHTFEVFRGFGYNRPVSGILACICTDWYTKGGRYVPQGAPSSPMIGNLYALHLDKRLEGLWTKAGFVYSRYADDLAFSSSDPKVRVRGLIFASYQFIKDEKLSPNPAKTKVLRKQHKKKVTGITVNEKINIDRRWMNAFRGELHRYSKFGLPSDGVQRSKIFSQLKGKMSFLQMIDQNKAQKYDLYFEKIRTEYAKLLGNSSQ